MLTAKYDRKGNGKKLRFILGNTTSDFSGAIYIKPGTSVEDITITFVIAPDDKAIFNYRMKHNKEK